MSPRRDLSCLVSTAVIGFCGSLQVEEVFLTPFKGMLKFWEETRMKMENSHTMVTFKGRFKRVKGENVVCCH